MIKILRKNMRKNLSIRLFSVLLVLSLLGMFAPSATAEGTEAEPQIEVTTEPSEEPVADPTPEPILEPTPEPEPQFVPGYYLYETLLSGKYLYPLEAKNTCVTQGFTAGVHNGLDIGGQRGDKVFAVEDGSISFMQSWDGFSVSGMQSYGNLLYLTLEDGTVVRYAHLDSFEGTLYDEFTANGTAAVKAGDVIGFVGTTGNSTGYHLHFEIRDVYGNPLDPNPLITHNPNETTKWDVEEIAEITKIVTYDEIIPENPYSSALGITDIALANCDEAMAATEYEPQPEIKMLTGYFDADGNEILTTEATAEEIGSEEIEFIELSEENLEELMAKPAEEAEVETVEPKTIDTPDILLKAYYVGHSEPLGFGIFTDSNVKIQAELQIKEKIPQFALRVRIPADMFGTEPAEVAVPMGEPYEDSFEISEFSPFNYRFVSMYENAEGELCCADGTLTSGRRYIEFFNYTELMPGMNTAWQILYRDTDRPIVDITSQISLAAE